MRGKGAAGPAVCGSEAAGCPPGGEPPLPTPTVGVLVLRSGLPGHHQAAPPTLPAATGHHLGGSVGHCHQTERGISISPHQPVHCRRAQGKPLKRPHSEEHSIWTDIPRPAPEDSEGRVQPPCCRSPDAVVGVQVRQGAHHRPGRGVQGLAGEPVRGALSPFIGGPSPTAVLPAKP